MRVGLLSDTHGKLRPEVFEQFADVQHILHAGDIGPAELLTELEAIAPVHAVSGTTDYFTPGDRIPEVQELELEGVRIAVMHGHQVGSPNAANLRRTFPDAHVIVYGHTHRALVERYDAALVVNPGAAGAARFRLLPSVGILTLSNGTAEVEIVELA